MLCSIYSPFVHVSLDEFRRDLSYYPVTVTVEPLRSRFAFLDEREEDFNAFASDFANFIASTARKAHTSQVSGKPIIHPEWRGFNWPILSCFSGPFRSAVDPMGISPESINWPASRTYSFRFTTPCPASFIFRTASSVFVPHASCFCGVPHPANHT